MEYYEFLPRGKEASMSPLAVTYKFKEREDNPRWDIQHVVGWGNDETIEADHGHTFFLRGNAGGGIVVERMFDDDENSWKERSSTLRAADGGSMIDIPGKYCGQNALIDIEAISLSDQWAAQQLEP